ncbi:DUF4097 family beta strand repeat-containing protein [Kibdelosporangium phytohabitans]|uniref:DUF4097 domain-containing protein n=1 Tax=Kibdelosporangium phytohabitans TaxID=860235 RepID=A0A0N9I580_9PSEU|nr:DUF4097 family beta strand repeat-containing protein [Kibdelosporangium phytohabitans]ALG09545.1 hypothetical protein AOZ06_23930 [Kibdelosporangium phytohabitans]MBE1469142.1 hypothetical protein [Kibdelosporangium phytohabitans]
MPTFATPEPITATLTTGGARVRITAGERPDTVVQVEPVDSANKSDVKVAEHTKVDFTAGELSIKTNKAGDRNGSVAITVELPAGSTLVLHTAWTDVHADGRLGDCELNIASGQVHLDRIAALRATLATGEVEIGHVAGAARIEGGTAGVRIAEAVGTVRYEGSTGKVWIGHASSDVALNGSGGSFDIDRADGSVIAKGSGCPIRVGRITRGQAELMNASGGIDIGISEGTAAWVDAKSTKGSVHSSLPAQDNPDEFGNKVKIYARTRLDNIVIHRADV